MKPDAILVNTSRGGIVNEKDLLEHLEQGGLAAVCLDVFENEPASDSPLMQHPRVAATPHIGGNSVEARRAMAYSAVDLLKSYLQKEGHLA
jgi:D-3-phosphoglycerate dehydrogenase